MEEKEFMLTTVDNPYNPFTHYDEWLMYDEAKGYFTNSFLARVVQSSHELSDADQSWIIDQAIDAIVALNPLGLYRKVAAPVPAQ